VRFCDAPDVAMWGSEEGERADGPVAIRRLFDEIVAFRGTLRFEWRDRLVHVEGDVAWVNAAGRLVVEPEGETARTGPYRVTAVLVRRSGDWRWHTHNGSEPRIG
jgi:ketosteroid isomerase-like protein